MKPVHVIYKLECYTQGDVSYLCVDSDNLGHYEKRMTIIKHNGGCFHCYAEQYDMYRANIKEVA